MSENKDGEKTGLKRAPRRRAISWLKRIGAGLFVLILLYVLLLIPESEVTLSESPTGNPFVWNRDSVWASLETLFKNARQSGCESSAVSADSLMHSVRDYIDKIKRDGLHPASREVDSLEYAMFHLAAVVAACPDRLPQYLTLYMRMREAVKTQSQSWDMSSAPVRRTLYRLLYGGRAAVEEIMLQAPPDAVPALATGVDEPSATPAAEILGVTIHSGDILVSRGGAPTSALIARGNDYPGNFSHVALVYVDQQTHKASVIESHIEKGVAVASLDEYLADKKLRVMVLRLRADLPQLTVDPLLPHKAASHALSDATSRHIPYDFEMDYDNDDKMFCSEVASTPYAAFGVRLWMGMSTISSPRLRMCLASLGVTHFETQEPSDLEYDPQLRVVAEWRDPATLYKDHLDNAVIDAMLDNVDPGTPLGYDRLLLPVARVTRGYSLLLNAIGKIGPVPEGMSAAIALRVFRFSDTHSRISLRLLRLADEFRQNQGFTPPYWVLVRLAGQAYGSHAAE